MSGPSANIQTTGTNQNTSNGGGIIGCAPEPFGGERSISKAFLHRFETWANLNAEQSVFKDQFRKCTLFLTYIIGPDVDDWVFAHTDKASQNRTDPQLWRALRTAFKEAFTDTGEKVTSLSKLENHKMIGGDVDKYITGFNQLLPLARFSANDAGVINMFQQGLQGNLLRQCIMHKSKDLVTLKDWQDEARAKQLAYWDAQQATGTLSSTKQQFY